MTEDQPKQIESTVLTSQTIHEIDGRLSVILRLVDAALSEMPDDDPRRQDLLEIKQAASAAAALLIDTRSDADKRTFEN